MLTIGTALRPSATRVMLLGSGELGKEVAIECQRLGLEVIAVDRYANAPAMHVAHRSHVINMLDGNALKAVIEQERPDYIVPEIGAARAPCGAVRRSDAPDHEPRRHPSPGGRNARPADLQLPFCRR